MASKNSFIKIGKLNISYKLIALVVAVILIVVAVISGVVRSVKKSNEKKAEGYTFTEIEGVKAAECIDEKIIVFTGENGKLGIMSLDGTVTEEAAQDKIYTVSEKWGKNIIVCEGPNSEYRLYVDAETGKIQVKQYHGADKPEKTPIWDEEKSCLVWSDEKTKESSTKDKNTEAEKTTTVISAIKPSELALDEGLYPITNTTKPGAKYGYINQYLELKIGLNYEYAMPFSDGLAAVMKDGKWGYIDINGSVVIDFQYDCPNEKGAYGFANGIAPVMKDGKWGLINKSNEALTSFNLEEILQGKDGKYLARKDGVWGILTLNAEILAKETTTAPETTAQEEIEGDYIVCTSGSPLNLRAEANVNSEILARIPNGTKIKISKIFSDWAYTTYGTNTGWVSTQYIEKAQISTVSQTSSEAVQ